MNPKVMNRGALKHSADREQAPVCRMKESLTAFSAGDIYPGKPEYSGFRRYFFAGAVSGPPFVIFTVRVS